jgi:hypothetical protein
MKELHANKLIEEIAFHRYSIAVSRLDKAISSCKVGGSREILDTTAYNSKIKRSPNMEILIRAYVSRRMVVAGRLMILFKRLCEQNTHNSPLQNWILELKGAVTQLCISYGGSENSTQAAHTSPGQVTIDKQLPWNFTKSTELKRELVRWFGDIYVVPMLVNDTDSYLDDTGDMNNPKHDVRNGELFLLALNAITKGLDPLHVFDFYCQRLAARISKCEEYLRFAPQSPDYVLGIYLDVIEYSPSNLVKGLEQYRDTVPV